MTFAATLFVPLALLLPETGPARDSAPATASVAAAVQSQGLVPMTHRAGLGEYSGWRKPVDPLQGQSQNQVRIEQRMTIRVVPRPTPRVDILTALPDGEFEPNLVEKKMAKCVPVSGIAGVQVNGPSNLILFMRDQRMVNAALERSCRARDFYSGFYLQNSTDGKLCVDRDTLLSRSGANCKLTRFRQLVEADD